MAGKFAGRAVLETPVTPAVIHIHKLDRPENAVSPGQCRESAPPFGKIRPGLLTSVIAEVVTTPHAERITTTRTIQRLEIPFGSMRSICLIRTILRLFRSLPKRQLETDDLRGRLRRVVGIPLSVRRSFQAVSLPRAPEDGLERSSYLGDFPCPLA